MTRITSGKFDVSGLDAGELAEFGKTKEQRPDPDAVDVTDEDPVPRDVTTAELEDDSELVELDTDDGDGVP